MLPNINLTAAQKWTGVPCFSKEFCRRKRQDPRKHSARYGSIPKCQLSLHRMGVFILRFHLSGCADLPCSIVFNAGTLQFARFQTENTPRPLNRPSGNTQFRSKILCSSPSSSEDKLHAEYAAVHLDLLSRNQTILKQSV